MKRAVCQWQYQKWMCYSKEMRLALSYEKAWRGREVRVWRRVRGPLEQPSILSSL